MFIAEGRTAGVFAALVIAAGPALVGSFTNHAAEDSFLPPTSVSDPALPRRAAGQRLNVVDGRNSDGRIRGDRPRCVAGPQMAPPVGHTDGGRCPNFRGGTRSS